MDNVETMILNNGYLSDNRLHKRWLIGQMLHEKHYEPVSYNYFLEQKPYKYQWTTLLQELKNIVKKEKNLLQLQTMLPADALNDLKNQITVSKSFFNRNLAETMLQEYMTETMPCYLWRSACHKHYKDKFEDRDHNLMIIDTCHFIQKMLQESDDTLFLKLLTEFVQTKIFMPSTIKKSEAWTDAFRKNGAYYTMHDLIIYHNCKFREKPNANTTETLNYLNHIPPENLFENLSGFIHYNNCSPETLYDYN